MIKITLNGETILVSEMNVRELLESQHYESSACAVAVDEIFVPRKQYEKTKIAAGNRIDIVSVIQGG